MKSDLHEVRRKCAVRTLPSEDAGPSSFDLLSGCVPASSSPWSRTCWLCRVELGLVVNRGAVCQSCRRRVCRQCREHSTVLQQKITEVQWVCTLCHKQAELQRATGEWMQEYAKNPGQKFIISAADLIKTTIQRSWTISETTGNWRTKKKQTLPDLPPLHKRHNSLPRGQDLSAYPSFKRIKEANKVDDPGGTTTTTTEENTSIVDENFIGKNVKREMEEESAEKKEKIVQKGEKSTQKDEKSAPQGGKSGQEGEKDEKSIPQGKTRPQQEGKSAQKGGKGAQQGERIAQKGGKCAQKEEKSAEVVEDVVEKKEEGVDLVDKVDQIRTQEDKKIFAHFSLEKVAEDIKKRTRTPSGTPLNEDQDDAVKVNFDEGEKRDIKVSVESVIGTDDYRLVYISSDSCCSSREDDDTESEASSSNAHTSSFDECDWDYFEPSVASDKGKKRQRPPPTETPKESPKEVVENVALWHGSACTSCGAQPPTQQSLHLQYVPVPVLVPVPFPVPCNELSNIQLFGLDASMFQDPVRLRVMQQRLAAAMNTTLTAASLAQPVTVMTANTQQSIQNTNNQKAEEEEEEETHSNSSEDNSDNSDSDADTDTDEGTVADKTKFNKIFVVNEGNSSSNEDSSSDIDESLSSGISDDENNEIVLNYIRPLNEEQQDNKEDPPHEDEDAAEVVLLKHVNFNLEDEFIDDSKCDTNTEDFTLTKTQKEEEEDSVKSKCASAESSIKSKCEGLEDHPDLPEDSSKCNVEVQNGSQGSKSESCVTSTNLVKKGKKSRRKSSKMVKMEQELEVEKQEDFKGDIFKENLSEVLTEEENGNEKGTRGKMEKLEEDKQKEDIKAVNLEENVIEKLLAGKEEEEEKEGSKKGTRKPKSRNGEKENRRKVTKEVNLEESVSEEGVEKSEVEEEDVVLEESGGDEKIYLNLEEIVVDKSKFGVAKKYSISLSELGVRRRDDDLFDKKSDVVKDGGCDRSAEVSESELELVVSCRSRSVESVSSVVDSGTKGGGKQPAGIGASGETRQSTVHEQNDTKTQQSFQQPLHKYTSLVMITQQHTSDNNTNGNNDNNVNVITNFEDDGLVTVKHTNKENKNALANYYTQLNEQLDQQKTPRKVLVTKTSAEKSDSDNSGNVGVITSGTLSSVVCLEDGLADDDSWVEEISYDEDESTDSSGEEVHMCTPVEGDLRPQDHEEELRGYHRAAIDFTLHTIVEESCEESEVETKPKTNNRNSATELEKYFYFDVGDGSVPTRVEDVYSETSSIYSESMDSLGEVEKKDNEEVDPAELASSRLEKYFLSGFMGFQAGRRDSDGSVGSDSEGRPSPEQRRKKLLRARNSRSHSSSLDNLLTETIENEVQVSGEASSDSDTQPEEGSNSFEKSDGQFDTVKRKKYNKKRSVEDSNTEKVEDEVEKEEKEKPETEEKSSRDSGFVGSTDDLINKEPPKEEEKPLPEVKLPPPTTVLTRKDSFNNWSSDEETNLMMSKMRQFFKTMIGARRAPGEEKKSPVPTPRKREKPPQLVYFENELTRLMKTVPGIREDQVREIVEYLSSEDTWSDSYDSSDYTSSDLEGVTVVRTALREQISASCRQIIDKFECEETKSPPDEEGDKGDGGIVEPTDSSKETTIVYQRLVASLNKISSQNGEQRPAPASPPLIAKVMQHIGTRLVALMHEVSSSGGESAHSAGSPKQRFHKRLQQKIGNTNSSNVNSSNSTTTTEDEDDERGRREEGASRDLDDDIIVPYNLLPRSRSHDLLLGDARHHPHINHAQQSSASRGSSCDVTADGEGGASDYERFSWRGSFESALMASTDSRQRLCTIGSDVSTGSNSAAVAAAVAAKRRSAGDLLFSPRFNQSREHLDRVRSCGSIGGATVAAANSGDESRPWVVGRDRPTRRRSSVPDTASGDSADGEDEDDDHLISNRSTTLPRSLQSNNASTTNSLPRLPTSAPSASSSSNSPGLKAHSVHHFLQNVKSARYRPPGFSRTAAAALAASLGGPKRAASAPGLQQPPRRRRSQQSNTSSQDDLNQLEIGRSSSARNSLAESAGSSPRLIGSRRLSHDDSNELFDNENTEIDDRTSQSSSTISPIHKSHSLSLLGARSDSMASVYSGAGDGRHGNVAVRGSVEFALQYNYKTSELEIGVKRCKDLAAVDSKRNRSDPYVKVYLLPDKSKAGKRKTKVKKHTLNPQFDETLRFQMSLDRLEQRTLWLTVWHSDMFGRNDFLGEVTMPLENFVFDDPTPKWYTLNERTEPYECEQPCYRGDIVVGLKYVPPDEKALSSGRGGRAPSRGTLHVLVKEAKNLTPSKPNGTADPFCKGYLLPDRARGNKQKTSVARRTLAPQWQHTFTYEDVTLQELAERSLELTVWDHDRLASNEFLGGVRFSLATGKHYGKPVEWIDATGKELQLWQSMLERPNLWVEGSVPLRSTLDNRNAPT